jgi:hypothetical protein
MPGSLMRVTLSAPSRSTLATLTRLPRALLHPGKANGAPCRSTKSARIAITSSVLRVVARPGFNDSDENARALAIDLQNVCMLLKLAIANAREALVFTLHVVVERLEMCDLDAKRIQVPQGFVAV